MKTEQQLDRLIAGLSSELTPSRDLWPELEQRLTDNLPSTAEAVNTHRWLSVPFASAYIASAASVLLAVTLFWQPAGPQPVTASKAGSVNPQLLDAETAIVYSFEQAKAKQLASMKTVDPVSYTHLTLPTNREV